MFLFSLMFCENFNEEGCTGGLQSRNGRPSQFPLHQGKPVFQTKESLVGVNEVCFRPQSI